MLVEVVTTVCWCVELPNAEIELDPGCCPLKISGF